MKNYEDSHVKDRMDLLKKEYMNSNEDILNVLQLELEFIKLFNKSF